MRVVEWEKDGILHKALVRNTDADSVAISGHGLPLTPPDVRELDWDEISRDLYNELVKRGLFTIDDVQKSQNGVSAAILTVIKRKVLLLYRQGGNNE